MTALQIGETIGGCGVLFFVYMAVLYRVTNPRSSKAPVSPGDIKMLMHQGAPLSLLERLSAAIPIEAIFDAVSRDKVEPEIAAMIIVLRDRGKQSWCGRVWSAVRWWR